MGNRGRGPVSLGGKTLILKALKIATFIGCTVGFIVNSLETLEKYSENATLVLTSTKRYPQLPAPDVILCYGSAFTETPDRKTYLTQENYVKWTRDPFDILLSHDQMSQIYLTKLGQSFGGGFKQVFSKTINHTVQELRTVLNGRCILIKFKDQVSIMNHSVRPEYIDAIYY